MIKIKSLIIIIVLQLILISLPLYASQSTIVEAEGYSCMGSDKSKNQTELDALTNAKRTASEYAQSHIESEILVKDMVFQKDLVSAYSAAVIKIINRLHSEWYKDASTGDCFKIRITAEVSPDNKKMQRLESDKTYTDDPSLPLYVKVWTDKKEYRLTEPIKVYVKANKPFYGRVVYKDAQGSFIQISPNPYRSENYFNGGAIYEIPSQGDQFELEISPPFGKESITVYASTSELGKINKTSAGSVYIVNKEENVGIASRGIKIEAHNGSTKKSSVAEFSESTASLITMNN